MANNAWDWLRGSFSLGGFGWLNNASAAAANGYTKRYSDKDSWVRRIANLGQYYESDTPSNAELGKWFKNNYGSRLSGNENASNYLKNISDADLGALIENNYYKEDDMGGMGWLLGNSSSLDEESLINDLQELANLKAMPKLEDYLGDYKTEATDAINKENAEILKMYDDNLARQTNMYDRELGNLNNNYNAYARQVLSNDYQKNASILNTYQSDMSRARQNSLEAGANAGLRIAGNINTLLSAQNKQASTSLETSNQLAQAMLNQRNAAASIRGQYGNMLNADTQNRANLKAGTYERVKSAQSNMYNERMNDYNVANQIATEKNGNYTSNPFYDSFTNNRKANNY